MSITVNGETVEQALIEQEISMLTQRYSEQLSPEELHAREVSIASDARENAIERVILAQEARKTFPIVLETEVESKFKEVIRQQGVEEIPADVPAEEVTRMRDAVTDSLRLDKYFAQVCKDVPKPTDAESRAYYEEHRDAFKSPEMVRAAHIVRRPAQGDDFAAFSVDMLNIREQALKGADFAELARQHSECSDNGGELGWFPRGAMVPAFENVVFALEPGQVSDVFRTEFGYHIAKVHEKRAPEPVPFERVRKDIKQHLFEQRKNDEIGRVVDRLRESAKIVETP